MVEHVLTIACAVFQASEQLYYFGRKSVHAGFERCVFACRLYGCFNLFAGFFNRFLNTCRMNTSVGNKSFKCKPCNFSSYRVKAGKRYCLRRIIDYKIAPREGFYLVNISSLSADDSSFHFVAGQRNNGYRRFRNLVGRKSLNSEGNDVLCLGVGFLAQIAFDLVESDCGFSFRIGFYTCNKLCLCGFSRIT